MEPPRAPFHRIHFDIRIIQADDPATGASRRSEALDSCLSGAFQKIPRPSPIPAQYFFAHHISHGTIRNNIHNRRFWCILRSAMRRAVCTESHTVPNTYVHTARYSAEQRTCVAPPIGGTTVRHTRASSWTRNSAVLYNCASTRRMPAN